MTSAQNEHFLARWTCSQLGAREHYAIPRALQTAGALNGLLTDSWVPPGSLFGRLKGGFCERFHADLATTHVTAWNAGLIAFELAAKARSLDGWTMILARNQWFQRQVVRALSTNSRSDLPASRSGARVLFSYSYTALGPFRQAKARGWLTVLGQIDPGPPEEKIVRRLYEANPGAILRWRPAPPAYWDAWREECKFADRIVVNSTWARDALAKVGVPRGKLHLIPLAFADPPAAFERTYPNEFTLARPLRVLFLGQVNLRKGVGPILDALRYLKGRPVELWFVGPIQIEVPAELRSDPQVKWVGPVPQGTAAEYYRAADIFLFPTYSDGFGLTQLEAQSWKLPVIASRFCGTVVRDGVNGWILPEVDGVAIGTALERCLRDPGVLARFSRAAVSDEEFSLDQLAGRLLALF